MGMTLYDVRGEFNVVYDLSVYWNLFLNCQSSIKRIVALKDPWFIHGIQNIAGCVRVDSDV